MNILFDQVINCIHWLDMFFPGRKDKIDWKEVGMMRSRLVHMRFAHQGAAALRPVVLDLGIKETEKIQTAGSMLANFRTMNGKSQDRKAIKHWCAKDEESRKKEKEMSERIESGRRAHEARQTSGSYTAVTAEETAAVYEVQYEPMNQASEAKIKEFLSGTADDINDLLFTNFNNVPVDKVGPVPLAAKFPLLTRFAAKAPTPVPTSSEPTEDSISQDAEAIAALEVAVKLDAIPKHPTELEPISLPVELYLDCEQDTKNEEGAECASMADARSRKAHKAISKSKSRRRK